MNNQEITQANNLCCPRCQLSHIKRNGHTYYGKQNYQCKLCDRQFVIKSETVSEEKRELIKSLLLERISLARHLPGAESFAFVVDKLYRAAISEDAG